GNGVELLAHDLVVADGVRAWPLRVIARVRRPEVAVLEPVEMASMGAWTSFRVRFREPVACSVGADRNWVSTPVDGNLLEWVIAGRRRGRLPWIEAATWPSGDLTYYYLIDRSRTRPGRR